MHRALGLWWCFKCGCWQAELDMADDQLAALWALNLEQEEEYQAKVDTPPGSAPQHSHFPTSCRL